MQLESLFNEVLYIDTRRSVRNLTNNRQTEVGGFGEVKYVLLANSKLLLIGNDQYGGSGEIIGVGLYDNGQMPAAELDQAA